MTVTTRPKQVLIVDRPLTAAILKNKLFLHDFKFNAAVSALDEVYDKLQEPTDLILLDLSLENFDYQALQDWLHQNRPELPCVAFTSDAEKAQNLGFKHFIHKPQQLMELHPWQGQGLKLMEYVYELLNMERKVKVMLVDDAALMIQVLNQILEHDKNLEVTVKVNNGEEALSALQDHQPDVILLDIEMPIMDGLSFLRHARVHSRARVIILSSVAMEGSPKAAEARRLGADAILAKPSGAVSINLETESGRDILDTIYAVLRAE